jgi:hypothetical protein
LYEVYFLSKEYSFAWAVPSNRNENVDGTKMSKFFFRKTTTPMPIQISINSMTSD